MRNNKFTNGTGRLFFLFLAIALIVSACSKIKDGETPSSTTTSSASVNIKVMDWQGQNPPFQAAYDNAIKDYMALHPNVTIEHIFQPLANDGYSKLLDTQFISHNAPDAVQLQKKDIVKYTNQEYLLALDPYFNQQTAYSEGKNWIDTFVGGSGSFISGATLNRFGSMTYIPVDGGIGIADSRPFFYNKDMLQKAGVTQPPQNWQEFIEASKKLKAAGFTPIAADNGRWLNWMSAWIGHQFGENYLNTFFDSKYADNRKLDSVKRDLAVLTGKVTTKDPIINAQVDILKDFSQYWQDGWAGVKEDAAQQLFLYQKAAFLVDGNWNYGFYKDNIKDFAWGVLPFPIITKETSQYAEEGFLKGGGDLDVYGWGINKDLEKDPAKLKVVLDFFQYLTSKTVQDKFVDTAVTTSPVVGVHVVEALKPFLETGKNKLVFPSDNSLFKTSDSTVNVPAAQQFFTGKITKEAYLSTLEQSAIAKIKKDAKDQLNADIGIPKAIATVQQQIADLQASKGPQILIDSLQKSLDELNLKLEMYKTYAEPVLK